MERTREELEARRLTTEDSVRIYGEDFTFNEKAIRPTNAQSEEEDRIISEQRLFGMDPDEDGNYGCDHMYNCTGCVSCSWCLNCHDCHEVAGGKDLDEQCNTVYENDRCPDLYVDYLDKVAFIKDCTEPEILQDWLDIYG